MLYRTHAQSRTIEAVLQQSFRIPISLIGGTRFYEYKEVKDLLAYLRLIANTSDDVAFKRIINVPKRGIGDTTVKELAFYAEQNDVSLLNAATSDMLPAKLRAKLAPFLELMTDLFVLRKELPLDELTQAIMEKIDYYDYLAEQKDGILETRVQNIEELLGAMREHMQDIEGSGSDPLDSFLENAALLSSSDGISEDDGTVKLMTLHSAKGLEFPVVFMPGMEENIFPSSRSREDEERLEEERRLCYVGITRAEQKLYLLNCRSRMLYGEHAKNRPSRFLVEMGMIDEDELNEIARFDIEQTYGARRTGFGDKSSGAYSYGSPKSKPANTQFGFNKPSVTKPSGGASSSGFGSSYAKYSHSAEKPSLGTVAVGDAYKKHQRVYHNTFGHGVITDVTGKGNSAIVTVDFEKVGIKRLAAAYTPMKVEDE